MFKLTWYDIFKVLRVARTLCPIPQNGYCSWKAKFWLPKILISCTCLRAYCFQFKYLKKWLTIVHLWQDSWHAWHAAGTARSGIEPCRHTVRRRQCASNRWQRYSTHFDKWLCYCRCYFKNVYFIIKLSSLKHTDLWNKLFSDSLISGGECTDSRTTDKMLVSTDVLSQLVLHITV